MTGCYYVYYSIKSYHECRLLLCLKHLVRCFFSQKINNIGVEKIKSPLVSMVMLGVLAVAFIGLGALYFVIVKSDASLSFASSQLLGGLTFSLGLILVIIAGAELFTGNNLLAMA